MLDWLLSRKPSGWRKPRFIVVKETEIAEYQSLVPETPPMNRRNFLVTALGAGFALSVQPVMADTAIVTDSEGLDAWGNPDPYRRRRHAAYRQHKTPFRRPALSPHRYRHLRAAVAATGQSPLSGVTARESTPAMGSPARYSRAPSHPASGHLGRVVDGAAQGGSSRLVEQPPLGRRPARR